MLFGLFRRRDDRLDALYASIVAYARSPVFYGSHGVPDTLEGRFELLVAATGLVVGRLNAGTETDRDAARVLSETFFADMDRSLREMGISDTGVPRRMKKIAQAFYGRVTVYETALAAGSRDGVREALVRNVYDGGEHPGADSLAAALTALHAALGAASPAEILSGAFVFPDPAAGAEAIR